MHEDSWWKLILLASVLALFSGIGVAQVLKPDWFIKRSGARKGGELLTEWNRLGFQFVGIVVAAAAAYGLYSLLSDYFSH